MESSERIEATHPTPSPCGTLVAGITENNLRIFDAQEPRRYQDIRLRNPPKDISALKWSRDSRLVAVLAPSRVEIMDLGTASRPIRIDNGTGSLGRFAAAEFVGRRHFLTIWEFGRAKLWDLRSGRGLEMGDLKGLAGGGASFGRSWRERPLAVTEDGEGGRKAGEVEALALLLRPAAEDVLQIQLLGGSDLALPAVKLPTVDAQAVSWSPDRRWITVLDSPRASTSLYVYTPDGHLFRSYPASPPPADSTGLTAKNLVWSPNSQILALAGFDGRITLLSSRTVTPIAVIEHATTIDQTSLPPELQAAVWQESVSASNERSYSRITQPFSPPLFNRKPSSSSSSSSTDLDPFDQGVAEMTFSSSGSLLATRDERTPSTIWLWNLSTLSTLAVIVQHRDGAERGDSLPAYVDASDPYSLRQAFKSGSDIQTIKANAANVGRKRAVRGVLKARRLQGFYEQQNENIERMLKPVSDHVNEARELRSSENLRVKVAVIGSFVANLLLAALQIYGAATGGSLSLFTTMADAIFDPLSNLALILCHRAINSVDASKYPSGKARIETAGNIAFCFLMTSVSFILIVQSALKLATGNDGSLYGTFHLPSVIAVSIAFCTKLGLFLYCWALKDRYSQINILWEDHRNDLFINGFGLLTSVGGSKLRWWIDPMGATILSVLIAFLWTRTAYSEFQLLIGKSAETSFLQHVTYISMTHSPDITALDTVRAWHSGPRLIVEVDIVVDQNMSVKDSHDVAEALQMKLESLPDVERAYVHIDYETSHAPEHFTKKEL